MIKESRDINKYTKDYLNHDFEDTMIYYRRKKILEILNKYNPEKILEVGCGTQSVFDFYNNYETFVVVEPSKQFCEMIKKSKNYNSKVTIINDFLENKAESLKNEKFDFIILSGLLHEVTEPIKMLKCIKQLCNNNTLVHINVPNAHSMHLLWAYKSGLIEKIGNLTEVAKHFQQHTTFTLESLVKMVDSVNFSIIEKGSYFIKPFNHSKMQKLLDEKIIDSNLLNGLYDLVEYFPNNGAEIYVNCKG